MTTSPEDMRHPPQVTPSRAAQILGVSSATVIEWGDKGYLPVYRTPSKHRRFREEDVFALLEKLNTVEATEAS